MQPPEKAAKQKRARIRLAAISLILSGVCFVLFPLVRPFFNESSLQGAVEFASIRWAIAHSFAIGGFILLSLGLIGVYICLQETQAERRAFWALILSWTGVGLTLPYFGAEAFSLQVIGQAAVNQNSLEILSLVNSVRYGPGIIFLATGLLLIAAATIILASAVWKSGILAKWSGVPLAIGFIVFIPLLQGTPWLQPFRIAVGLLIAAGCLWIAGGMLKHGAPPQ